MLKNFNNHKNNYNSEKREKIMGKDKSGRDFDNNNNNKKPQSEINTPTE
jgi:hypothetical protein